MSKYQVFIRDASGEVPGKPNKGKWVDCDVLSGEYTNMTNAEHGGDTLEVHLTRTYWNGTELFEQPSVERFYYKRQVRTVE